MHSPGNSPIPVKTSANSPMIGAKDVPAVESISLMSPRSGHAFIPSSGVNVCQQCGSLALTECPCTGISCCTLL